MERNTVLMDGLNTQHGRCSISILLKLIYRFNTIHIKIPDRFFVDIEEFILKFYGKAKKLELFSVFWKRINSYSTHF